MGWGCELANPHSWGRQTDRNLSWGAIRTPVCLSVCSGIPVVPIPVPISTDGRTDDIRNLNTALCIVHRAVKSCGNIRHCAQSAFRPPVVGIRPLLSSFHWSAFRRSAFGHAPIFTGSIRTQAHEKFWRKGSLGESRDCPNFLSAPYYLRNG